MTKLLATCAVAALACAPGCLKRTTGARQQAIAIKFLEVAEGATTIALSPDDAYLVAEIPPTVGALYRPAEPKQVRLFDTATWSQRAASIGWAIGEPAVNGDALVLAPSLDRVEWMVSGKAIALAPPPGADWQLLGAAAAHSVGRAFVVLAHERLDGLWVAALDTRSGSVRASAALDGDRNCGVAGASATRPRLFISCLSGPGDTSRRERWRVVALDAAAEAIWESELDVASELGGNHVRLATSGDGRYLVVIHGDMKASYGTQNLTTLSVLDTASGAARQAVEPDWPETQRIRNLASVPGTSEVALLHLYVASSHAMFASHDSFSGITTVDAAAVKPGRRYEVSRTTLGKELYETLDATTPEAIAVRADGTVLLVD
jgi:hypothetical protein